MKGLWKNWYIVTYVLLLVLTLSFSKKNKTNLEENLSKHESYETEEIPEDSFEIIEEFVTLRPIPIVKKNKLYKKTIIIEPDAEMLPVNYKGIQSPGVDHMEMIFAHPNTLGSHIYKTIILDPKTDVSSDSEFITEKDIPFT